MSLPRELITAVRRLDEYDLRRLQILVRGLLLHADGEPTPGEEPGMPTVSYRQQHVRCGKAHCSTCPHGPYWYAFWKEDGRTRKQYIGRHLPGQPLEAVIPEGSRGDAARDQGPEDESEPGRGAGGQ